MKKVLIIILSIIIISPSLANAQSPTTTKLPSTEEMDKISDKVDQLKNKVASRVAELNLVEKRGFIGTVTEISESHITVTDLNNKTRIIQVDELTKFSSEKDENFGLSDIKKGGKIGALGLYNKDSRKLLARFINEINIPVFIQGVVEDINEKDFSVTLLTEGNKKYIVDIENITKTFELADEDLDSSGFSKIKKSQNIFIVGYPDANEDNRISATKAVIVPDLPQNPKIEVDTNNGLISSPTPSALEEEDQ